MTFRHYRCRIPLLFVAVVLSLIACVLFNSVEGIENHRHQNRNSREQASNKFLDINGIINKVANWPIDKFPNVKKWIEHGLKSWTLSNFTTIKKEVDVHINLAHANNARLDKAHVQTKSIIKLVETSKSKADEVEAMAAGQIAKLRRSWANEDVRTKYEALRLQRVLKESKMETQNCNTDQKNHIVIFPAIALQEEVDEKTCINKNRDEVIEAFCNFRGEFDKVLKNRNLKDTKHYWPNICCKGHGDSKGGSNNDDSCNDPNSTIKRENIVPFALAQGGKITYKHLYGEVVDILNPNGYLHEGMKRVVEDATKATDINEKRLKALKESLEKSFNGISLCGPRVFTSPTSSEIKMCEMFYPYKHLLNSFHIGFDRSYAISRAFRKDILVNNDVTKKEKHDGDSKDEDANSLIEMMKGKTYSVKTSPLIATLKKKQSVERTSEESDNTITTKSSCPIVRGSMKEDKTQYFGTNTYTLDQYKNEFCKYEHLDLADTRLVNVAMLFAGDDFDSKKYKYMNDLAKIIKFEVTDECSSPMFSPNDISLQNIAIDGKQDAKWVAIIKLDSTTKNGYIRNELLKCKSLDYLPKTNLEVRIFVDPSGCCEGTKDVSECKKTCALAPMKHFYHKESDMKYTIHMKGSSYELQTGHGTRRRRRRLFWGSRSGC